jgi:Ca-activated chloride channel homolog
MTPRSARRVWALAAIVMAAGFLFVYARFVWPAAHPWSWTLRGTHYVLASPRLLGLLLVVPLLAWVQSRSLADLPWQQRWISLLCRTLFVLCLAASVSRIGRTEHKDDIVAVLLIDVSDSVTDPAIADARRAASELLAARRPSDVVRVVTFARRPRLVPTEGGARTAPALERHDGDATDLQAALHLAYGLLAPGYLRRVVIYSDGIETAGDLLSESGRASASGVKVFVVPYGRPVPGEMAISELSAPDHVKVGEPFEVTAEIYASRGGAAKVQLYQGDVLNGLEAVKEISLSPGKTDVGFKSVVRVPGEVTYRVVLTPGGEDRFASNNQSAVTIDVPGRPTVLYVEGDPAHATPLASALEKQGFDVDVRPPTSFPASLREIERYDFVVLSDTPAEQISTSSQETIESYLRDVGGGFLFAGGPNGYAPGGWQHTALERVLPVRMDDSRRKEMPTIAMALVIDRSGSMTGLPLEMAKQAARATVSTLAPDDLLEVIAFDSVPTRYVKVQPARNRSRIETDIGRIQAGGGTEIFAALDAAYQDLSVVQARKKHVILLTDGRASSSGIRDLVQAMAAESITVTTVGLGNEVDDQLLSMIKDFGGGRYHKVPDPNSLPKIFTREAEMVAKTAASADYFPVRQAAPADFLRGIAIDTAPLLGGLTETQMKPPPAQEILANGDTGDPVLARWRVGLGWSLAWTSDVKARWAASWTRWAGWPRLFGQLVHEHMRQKKRSELEMRTTISLGRVHAVVDAFTADDRFDNGLDSKLTIEGPIGKGLGAPGRHVLPMKKTAPGRYEASFDLEAYGSFLLRAQHARAKEDGQLVPVAVSYGHVSNPYPLEYATLEPDTGKLERIASATGGARDPLASTVFDPAGEKTQVDQDLWPRFVGAAIALLLLDLLMRRVRLFDRKFVARAKAA